MNIDLSVPEFKLVNEEEHCMASKVLKCIQEKSAPISWIQCTLCRAWYHMICCGLGDKNRAKFVCCSNDVYSRCSLLCLV